MHSSKLCPSELSWEVIPAEGRRGIGGPAPLGSVRLWSDETGVDYISVPAAVSRTLAYRQKKREISASTREELERLIHDTTVWVCKNRVAEMVNRRDYARQELADRLVADGYPRRVVEEILCSAEHSGLVDDVRFAAVFIRSKANAGWGLSRIERELARRGVKTESLEGWPYEFIDPDEELTRALEAAERKHVREPNAYAKLVRFLVGRGFSYHVAKTAAARALDKDR